MPRYGFLWSKDTRSSPDIAKTVQAACFFTLDRSQPLGLGFEQRLLESTGGGLRYLGPTMVAALARSGERLVEADGGWAASQQE